MSNVVLVRYLEGDTAKTEVVDVGEPMTIDPDFQGLLVINGEDNLPATFRREVVLWWKIVPKKEKR